MRIMNNLPMSLKKRPMRRCFAFLSKLLFILFFNINVSGHDILV